MYFPLFKQFRYFSFYSLVSDLKGLCARIYYNMVCYDIFYCTYFFLVLSIESNVYAENIYYLNIVGLAWFLADTVTYRTNEP
jgi:hypothetical protein